MAAGHLVDHHLNRLGRYTYLHKAVGDSFDELPRPILAKLFPNAYGNYGHICLHAQLD